MRVPCPRSRTLTGLLATATAVAATVPVVHGAPAGGTRHVEVGDPQLQLTAYTLELPAGWRFAGNVEPVPGCHSAGAGPRYIAQAPDGVTAVLNYPSTTWSYTSSAVVAAAMEQQGCPSVAIRSAQAFLLNIVLPSLHGVAQVLEILPPRDADQAALTSLLQRKRAENASLGQRYHQPPQQISLDGARLHVQALVHGHPVEEMISTVVECFEAPTVALRFEQSYQQRTCSSYGVSVTRAPRGRLDATLADPVVAALSGSLKMNPAWTAQISARRLAAQKDLQDRSIALTQKLLASGWNTVEQTGRMNRETQRQTSERTRISMEQDRRTQAQTDDWAHRTVLQTLDREDFRDAHGNVVEASNQYLHQWLSSDGQTLVQCNDPSCDPNGVIDPVRSSWTELTPR